MIRRPPRSTLSSSSAASDVYKRQISDGVLPANEGRGYVLRKIIRRAITHGRLLGYEKPFLHKMVFAVRDLMENAYPELKDTVDRVSKIIGAEETRFTNTLTAGLARLE